MHVLLLAPILYVVAVVETSLGDLLRIGTIEPALLALLAIVWLLRRPGPWGFLVAGVIGLVEDLLAPGRIGLGLASYLVVGYALTWLRPRLRLESFILQVIAVLVAATGLTIGQAFGGWLLGMAPGAPGPLVIRALGVAVYTAGVSVPVLMVLGWTGGTRTQAPLGLEP